MKANDTYTLVISHQCPHPSKHNVLARELPPSRISQMTPWEDIGVVKQHEVQIGI